MRKPLLLADTHLNCRPEFMTLQMLEEAEKTTARETVQRHSGAKSYNAENYVKYS
jgi:hypothetical protein